MSVHRCTSNNPTPTAQIFAKFYSRISHWNSSTKFNLVLKQTKKKDIL